MSFNMGAFQNGPKRNDRQVGLQPWYSLDTLKLILYVFSEYQDCHTDGLSISVYGGFIFTF